MDRKLILFGNFQKVMLVIFWGIFLFSAVSFSQKTDTVKEEIFKEINKLLETAVAEDVPLLSPSNYSKAYEFYQKALERYNKGDKLKDVREELSQARIYLNAGFEASKVSRVALEDLLTIRKTVVKKKLSSYALKEFSDAEEYFKKVVEDAEKGDIRSVRSKSAEVEKRYRKTVAAAYKKAILKEAEDNLDQRKKMISKQQYKSSKSELKEVEKWIKQEEDTEFVITDFTRAANAKIADVLEVIYPEFYRNLPDTLLIGDYTLYVVSYETKGVYSFKDNVVSELSGLAEFSYDCGLSLLIPFPGLGGLLIKEFIVVNTVIDAEREISLSDARKIDPSIKLGAQMPLQLKVESLTEPNILEAKIDVLETLTVSKGDIRVKLEDVTIEPTSTNTTGRIIGGYAYYPTVPPKPEVPAEIYVAGFTVHIDSLVLTPDSAFAQARLEFPASVYDGTGCGPAIVDLGTVKITPDCQLYKAMPDSSFGPFVVGNTGLIISGTGLTVDLSLGKSPGGMGLTDSWRGVILHSGNTDSEPSGSVVSNTGYLKGQYGFTNAKVVSTGLEANFTLTGTYSFNPVNPIGYTVQFSGASLKVNDSEIKSGRLESGEVRFPSIAVCKAGSPGSPVSATFDSLKVYKDLDLGGQVSFGTGTQIGWGELTHPGDELIAWEGGVQSGYMYLPAGPTPSFSPGIDTSFIVFQFPWTFEDIITRLDTSGMAGVTINGMGNINIYTPDVPGGTTNPIKFTNNIDAWLRIGALGLDGQCKIYELSKKLDLGNTARYGYVGNEPFKATLMDLQKSRGMLIQYAMSAVYDSEISGTVDIPVPCGLDGLEFADMEASSTANLVGGDIILPVAGDTLEYWQLLLVPTGDPEQAGVVSVRTGRLVFTAAGISEPIHFAKPFGLTWGEIFADGNFGELFFDYNDYGQRFDNIAYSPHFIALSEYVVGNTDGYLYTCGTVHINYFGPCYVNIHDARYDASSADPYYNRYVTVPKTPEDVSCGTTDLHLEGEWDDALGNSLSMFDFPDATMDYNTTIQNGFIGTGSAGISFIHSNGLDATVEVHGDTIDICLTSGDTHDLDFGLYASIGSIGQINGCVRIVGPLMERIAIDGYIESAVSTGSGILAPKAGYYSEFILSVTPNSATFNTSGDMLFQFAGNAVDISGSVFLKVDYTKTSAEGEIIGRIDCNTVVAGLNGEGQITWYVDKTTQYLQGKVSIEVMSWGGGVGLEGGVFLGVNVPKAKAWVLQTGSEHFGVSDAILPSTLTGLYGYGQLSFSVQWYIFGGGIEIYAGMGAFTGIAGSGVGSIVTDSDPLMIIGSVGVYVHGEILGGLVSASAWGDLDLRVGLMGMYFEGTFGLEGCVLWVLCASVDVTAGLSPEDGFYMH